MGPGLGHAGKLPGIIEHVLLQVNLPVVLDADGINVLMRVPTEVLRRREMPTVLTPHPGELRTAAPTNCRDPATARITGPSICRGS